jgi:hypothetical protein
MWQFSRWYEQGHHPFSRDLYESKNPRNAIVALQENVKVCVDQEGLIFDDGPEPSRLPFGQRIDPEKMEALCGLTLEFSAGNIITSAAPNILMA